MVVGVGDVHLPGGYAQSAGFGEQSLISRPVPVARLPGTQHGEAASGHRQHPLNLMVVGVGHVYSPEPVHRYLPGEPELAIAADPGTPLAHEGAIAAEHLHPVIKMFEHVYSPGLVHRYPRGGVELAIASALRAPFEMLLSNCGEDFNDIWNALHPHVLNRSSMPKYIFDASAHKIVDAESAGIIEPAKVCRVSIGNALSVASLLITLGGIVVTPRDFNLENQLALSRDAFKSMMDPNSGFVGQE